MSKDISIIITGHKEGLILHKTILSLLTSAEKLDSQTKYEIVLNLDNPDKETTRVANLWQKDDRFIINEVSFGNPADNRNDAIQKARGKYISIIDGDDLISDNWLPEAYKLAKKQTKDFILRPEVHLQFGYEETNCVVWRMRNSRTKQEDAVQMAYWNLWTNALFTNREVLIDTPFKNATNGFGFEDYLFNTETRSKNIPNLIVPQTVLFYRKRKASVSTIHRGTILGYSDLFDISFMKSLPVSDDDLPAKPSTSQKIKKGLSSFYQFSSKSAQKINFINKTLSPAARNALFKKKSKLIPNWLVTEWSKINKIENQLYPTKGQIAKLDFHPLTFEPSNNLGQIYKHLCHQLSDDHLDYLFLAPAGMTGRGGTEKLISNYIKALKIAHPDWKIGILSLAPFTDLASEYFKSQAVDMIDFGKLTQHIGQYEKDIIWSRLLVQSRVKRLHLVNDEYWYKWIYNHQELLIKNNYKLYISLFMREFTHDKDQIKSFADPDLMEIWPTVTKVFTDNQRVINDALKNNAFEESKMITHYQPQDFDEIIEPRLINSKGPLKILWASRIAFQKRPDILKKIAAKLGDNFEIDAYGLIEKKQYKTSYFNDSKIDYRGNFNGIKSIDTEKYDVYLYTSQTDGVPNILMEVAAAGLPIVASDAGGVSEVIKDKETGYLVDIEDIDGYVSALKEIRKNPESAQEYTRNLQKLVKKQHSWDNFINKVKKDIK